MMIDLTFNIVNNDCELIIDEVNMVKSCIRRLNTLLDSTLYDEYGSNIHELLGLRKTEINLQFLNQTIVDCLLQDERISECNVSSEYTVESILVRITIVYGDNVLEFDYEVSSEDDVDG